MTSAIPLTLLEVLATALCDVEDVNDLAAVLHDTSCRCTEAGGRYADCRDIEFYQRWVREIQREVDERADCRAAARTASSRLLQDKAG